MAHVAVRNASAVGFALQHMKYLLTFYNEAQQNLILVSKLYALLSGNALASQPAIIKCKDCSHNQGDACAFEFPEYDTTESHDCNHYEH
jgi:hypothetical protein